MNLAPEFFGDDPSYCGFPVPWRAPKDEGDGEAALDEGPKGTVLAQNVVLAHHFR
jgi:hypothetical protein